MLPDIRPGNTKILYFFNCLLDGMHTKIKHICDFSRCRLNVRVKALASNLCSEATNMLYLSKEGCALAGEEILFIAEGFGESPEGFGFLWSCFLKD